MELRFPRFQISLDSGLALCSRKNRWEKDSPHPAYPRILLSHKSTEEGGAEIWGLFFLLIPKKKRKSWNFVNVGKEPSAISRGTFPASPPEILIRPEMSLGRKNLPGRKNIPREKQQNVPGGKSGVTRKGGIGLFHRAWNKWIPEKHPKIFTLS